jgi:hypothetical protein
MSHQRRDSDETLLCMDRSSPKGPQREAGRGAIHLTRYEIWNSGTMVSSKTTDREVTRTGQCFLPSKMIFLESEDHQ